MRIWIDADACPKVIKEILYRVAERTQISLTLVANMQLQYPKSAYIDSVRVTAGADIADAYIIDNAEPGDLAITADIPFAAGMVEKGGFALNPRGELYTADNVRTALSIRNMMDEMRCNGVITGGPPAFNHGDRQAFANQLDRFIAKHWKQNHSTS